jgi:radical SAM/Cys-rich protein
MTDETVDRILNWVERTSIQTVDLTGGAPEMVPAFRRMISQLSAMKPRRHIIDRCNLTILHEPGYEGLAEFLAENRVEIVASMPCYSPDNVNAQRGDGVFDASISALKHLNTLGYGREDGLPLHLVYNPLGANLPPDQAELEAEYKTELRTHFGIEFHRLYTITNMAIARFASWLKRNGTLAEYQQLLIQSFNPGAVNGLMCRDTVSIDWQGDVYDCDFNQQLGMRAVPVKIWDLRPTALDSAPILTGEHCFGCTAGSGSSCGGSLVHLK